MVTPCAKQQHTWSKIPSIIHQNVQRYRDVYPGEKEEGCVAFPLEDMLKADMTDERRISFCTGAGGDIKSQKSKSRARSFKDQHGEGRGPGECLASPSPSGLKMIFKEQESSVKISFSLVFLLLLFLCCRFLPTEVCIHLHPPRRPMQYETSKAKQSRAKPTKAYKKWDERKQKQKIIKARI